MKDSDVTFNFTDASCFGQYNLHPSLTVPANAAGNWPMGSRSNNASIHLLAFSVPEFHHLTYPTLSLILLMLKHFFFFFFFLHPTSVSWNQTAIQRPQLQKQNSFSCQRLTWTCLKQTQKKSAQPWCMQWSPAPCIPHKCTKENWQDMCIAAPLPFFFLFLI